MVERSRMTVHGLGLRGVGSAVTPLLSGTERGKINSRITRDYTFSMKVLIKPVIAGRKMFPRIGTP